ncbi:DUF935 domain-containing protein [Candidatus Methylocalor cossyra]|uniref:Mu-like prophage FluMu protein gp29 n=1 Tax=Candidatus Methylocalor cossyra TaxID=3108543 RepID=A0ABM9NL10_9GAMM
MTRRPRGLYVSPRDFVRFADPVEQIVTRQKSLDWYYVAPFWLPNPDPVLKKQGQSIAIYRDLLSDAHVGGCVRRRKASVKSMGWQVLRGESPARVHKAIVSMLNDLDMPRLINEALDAALFGYQPFEIIWRPGGGMAAPLDVVGKPPEWFMFNADNELRFRSRANPFAGDALPPDKFLLARQRPTYQNPYGFPDLSLVFWPTVFKRAGLKFWARFVEKYGTPWLIGKHPRGMAPAEVEELLDQLEAMVDDAVAAIPNDSSLDIVEAAGKGASADLYREFILMCRSEVTIALLGQNQNMERDSTHASALAGQAVTEDIRDDDATMVAQVVNELIRLVCRLNWGDVPAPRWELYAKEQIDNTRATRDKTLKDAGLQFTRHYWIRTYNLADEDVVPEGGAQAAGTEEGAAFAEVDPAVFPAQAALEDALDALDRSGQLQDQAKQLLAPVIAAARKAKDETELLGALAEAYPAMQPDALVDTLTRLLFAANLAGRLEAGGEAEGG